MGYNNDLKCTHCEKKYKDTMINNTNKVNVMITFLRASSLPNSDSIECDVRLEPIADDVIFLLDKSVFQRIRKELSAAATTGVVNQDNGAESLHCIWEGVSQTCLTNKKATLQHRLKKHGFSALDLKFFPGCQPTGYTEETSGIEHTLNGGLACEY